MPDSEEIRSVNRRLDGIITTTTTVSGSTTLANTQHATFTVTTTSNSAAKVFAIPDITLYIGSVSADNAFPDGASVDPSQWQIIGPLSDWGATDNVNHVTKLYIRNISAGSQTVIIKADSRMIINSPTLGGNA